MPILEKTIQQKVNTYARKTLLLRCIKLSTQGQVSYPDYLYFICGGRPLLIEFKRPGNKPTSLQQDTINVLKNLGYDTEVHDNADEAIISLLKRCADWSWSKDFLRAELEKYTARVAARKVPT